MTSGFTKLRKFPRNRLIEDELLRCRASELDLFVAFGEPTLQTPADDADPTFYWDMEWSCEMVMGLQFKQLTEILTIRLDQPETHHALRHLGFEVTDLWTLEEDSPERFAELCEPPDLSWELWRQVDGEKECVAKSLTERDADCWRDSFADTDDAPRHWVTRAT